jgi:WxL domain surface cell wall-binding
MRQLKNRSRGLFLCFVLLLAFAISGSAIAHADSGGAKAILNAGGLTFSKATNHVSLKLNKKVQLSSYTLPITVIDARGSGSGWNLAITSTNFTITNGKGQLPANASSISKVTASCGSNSTCTNPIDNVSYPLVVPAGTTPPPAVKFFNAKLSTGLGKFSLVMMVNVTIPASAISGTYTSTILLTIANGP